MSKAFEWADSISIRIYKLSQLNSFVNDIAFIFVSTLFQLRDKTKSKRNQLENWSIGMRYSGNSEKAIKILNDKNGRNKKKKN